MTRNKMIAAGAGTLAIALVIGAGGMALADEDDGYWAMHTREFQGTNSQMANMNNMNNMGNMGNMGNMNNMGQMANMGNMDQMGSMSEMNVTDEFGYLTMMIPHHEEAIASAIILRDGTEDPEMRAFAEAIIETQSNELIQMENWLATWYPGRDISVDYTPMMRDLSGLSGDSLDQAFLEDMIPHHMAAVMMSQQLLTGEFADHSEVEPFALTIRDNQHAEIGQMVAWLAN